MQVQHSMILCLLRFLVQNEIKTGSYFYELIPTVLVFPLPLHFLTLHVHTAVSQTWLKFWSLFWRYECYSIHTNIIDLGKPSAVTWKLAVLMVSHDWCFFDRIMFWNFFALKLLDHIPILLYRGGHVNHLFLAAIALCFQQRHGNHGFKTGHKPNMHDEHVWADTMPQAALASAHSTGADLAIQRGRRPCDFAGKLAD